MIKALFIIILGTIFSTSMIFAQKPSEVFIQQANVEYKEAVLQFTSDFTTAFFGQMMPESFEEYDSDMKEAIVN